MIPWNEIQSKERKSAVLGALSMVIVLIVIAFTVVINLS